MSSDSFKNNVTYKLFVYKSYKMFKQDLALNNSQGLICHKTQPNHYQIGINSWKNALALNNPTIIDIV